MPGSGIVGKTAARPIIQPAKPVNKLAKLEVLNLAASSLGPKLAFNFKPYMSFGRWRHFSIIALAALVATIGMESNALVASTDIAASTQFVGSVTPAKANFDLSLPQVKTIDLPPVPVKKVGVGDPYLQASNVIIFDDASKLPLYEKKANDQIAVASTTKIVTALTALELYKDLDRRVDISAYASGQIGSAVGLRPGETATIRQLLYGLMMVSGNDAAIALSELVNQEGGEAATAEFVALMNNKAKQLGMNDSYFTNPVGFDGGYSSSTDMAKAMSELIKKPELVKMINSIEYSYRSPEGYDHVFRNSNRLLAGGEMPYAGIIGGKTGYTPKNADGTGAGHCLIVAAERNGRTLIVGIFDTYSQTPQASAEVARAALDYGFNSFEWQAISR